MKKYPLFCLLFVLLAAGTARAATLPTLTDKIDQMIMVGFDGTTIGRYSDIENILEHTNVGGVLLFDYNSQTKTYGKNIVSGPQVAALNAALQAKARTPLFIAIDEEGGQVSRLKRLPGFVPLPSASTQGKTPLATVLRQQLALGGTLHTLGFTVNFAPVLDLTSANKNAPMTKQQRTFSADPKTVADYASAVIVGMRNSSVIPVGKHYPGIGEAAVDTHKGLATLAAHSERALVPYALLSSQQLLPAVMVGHVLDKNVDPLLPASLSPEHLRILRERIGFTGVVFTDDLDMGAVTERYPTGKAVVAAVRAGVDVAVISNNITAYNPAAFFEARNALLAAVSDGTLSEARIDQSYERIMKLKAPILGIKR